MGDMADWQQEQMIMPEDDTPQPCPSCLGEGFVMLIGSKVICPICSGTGGG